MSAECARLDAAGMMQPTEYNGGKEPSAFFLGASSANVDEVDDAQLDQALGQAMGGIDREECE